ncbi:MAG TPA: WcaI family glycosyltransferase [Segetibacter sp.]|jgi:colanic acid biosynthesis glycosyl transferase WcaI
MENQKILLIGGNYFPEPTGIGKYNGEMVDWLSNNGFSCTVVTTFPYYPYWKIQDPYCKRCFWYKKEVRQASPNALPINIIRSPHYVPSKPTSIKRIISDFSFFFSAYLVIISLLFRKKYDLVITVAPPFQLGLLAILYKKIKGAKFSYHIQDLQVDAARDLNMVKSKTIINLLFSVERFILRNADVVSSISAGMIRKVEEKCNKEVLLFPNWVDTNTFYPLENKHELKKQFGFKSSDKIILYSGAIGEKQGLEAILHSADFLRKYTDIKFLICGSGPYKEKLQLLKDKLKLENVIFFPLQSHSKFNAFLNLADVHLLLQKENASDLVMPSKLTAILSIGGVAIVTAKKGTSLFEVVDSAEAGILIDPENQEALNNSIMETIYSVNNKTIALNARLFAEKNLSINEILTKYKFAVQKVGNKKDKNFSSPVFAKTG